MPVSCQSSSGTWRNQAFAQQRGTFSADFYATPSFAGSSEDAALGLSSGTASDFTNLASIVRFNTSGFIDARNGGSYTAANSIPYSAQKTYHFFLTVNTAAHTYTAYVSSASASPQLIGNNFAFRTEQASLNLLNNFGFDADIGGVTACNFNITPSGSPSIASISPNSATAGGPGFNLTVFGANFLSSSTVQWNGSARPTTFVNGSQLSAAISAGDILSAGTAFVTVFNPGSGGGTSNQVAFTINSPPPSCLSSSGTWMNVALTQQQSTFGLDFYATPSFTGSSEDAVLGLSSGATSAYTSLASIVRFNTSGFIDARNGGNYTAATSIPYLARTPYHFFLSVNTAAHTYSAYVSSPAASAQLIGSNFAFRAEVANLSLLNNFGFIADVGGVTACNVNVSTATSPLGILADTIASPILAGGPAGVTSAQAADLSTTRVFPNPWRVDRHAGLNVTIDGLPAQSEVRFYTVSGRWVKTVSVNGAGSGFWDLTNDSGQSVASGIYLYLIRAPGVGHKSGTLAVIR